MSAASPEPIQAPSSEPIFRVRIVYREATGPIHFDWPVERLAEALQDADGIVWVDLDDQGCSFNAEAERILRDVFHFHPLAIEDALRETHVPRVDDWGDYLYIVFHSIEFDPRDTELKLHELDVFLGENFLVTYHTEPLAYLEQDRRNIERDPVKRMRHGPDHLLYRFLDMAVAEFLPAIERLDEVIDEAQEEVFERPTPETIRKIFRVKRAALRLHRILSPEREVMNRLARDAFDPIADDHRVYFRDVYDHIVRVHDLTETLRDLISGALDTYLSAISNRTNDIMKALTTFTVMFLPMSFLTGFFGMNFFGETLAFQIPLPRTILFLATCGVMAGGFSALGYMARRKGWI